MTTTAAAAGAQTGDQEEFSLVRGGPLFHLLVRWRLCDPSLGLAHRRMLAGVIIIWLPLLILSQSEDASGGEVSLTFLGDLGLHLRFLFAVPLLLGAEVVVHRWLRPIIDQFDERGLVRPGQRHRFETALAEALRLRNSVVAELVLIALVYAVGVPFSLRRSDWYTGWYAQGPPGAKELTLAGWWLVLVSLPIFQFLLCRWYFRLLVWLRLLWRISRLDLDLDVTHPDRAGGIGFLGTSLIAFLPLAAAHGLLLAGVIATNILYAGAALPQFTVQVIGAILVLLLLFAGPLTVFTPLLAEVKRKGLLTYGSLAQTYVRAFDDKWRRGGAPADESLLGSGDIQSLADLANSYAVADQMRIVPLSNRAIVQFVLAIIVPVVPLIFTMMSAEELLGALAGMFV